MIRAAAIALAALFCAVAPATAQVQEVLVLEPRGPFKDFKVRRAIASQWAPAAYAARLGIEIPTVPSLMREFDFGESSIEEIFAPLLDPELLALPNQGTPNGPDRRAQRGAMADLAAAGFVLNASGKYVNADGAPLAVVLEPWREPLPSPELWRAVEMFEHSLDRLGITVRARKDVGLGPTPIFFGAAPANTTMLPLWVQRNLARHKLSCPRDDRSPTAECRLVTVGEPTRMVTRAEAEEIDLRELHDPALEAARRADEAGRLTAFDEAVLYDRLVFSRYFFLPFR